MKAPQVIGCSWLSERETMGRGRTAVTLDFDQGKVIYGDESTIFTTDTIMGEITTMMDVLTYRKFLGLGE